MDRVSAGFDSHFTYEVQKWAKASKNHSRFADNDVAFAKISPSFENRKSFIAKGLHYPRGGGTTELIVLRQARILPDYTQLLVLDQRFIDAGSEQFRGIVGQQRVKPDIVKSYLVPIPPIEEQKRIVARVQQVFSVLDDIDELQQLYSDNTAALKSLIMEAAIRGELTTQQPMDGTADELIAEIRGVQGEELSTFVYSADYSDEAPFAIPSNWRWVKLSDIGSTNIGLTYHPEDISDEGTIVVRSSNIVHWKMDYQDLVKVNCPIKDNQYLYQNDIVICARNGSKSLVGKCAIFNGESKSACFGAFMAVFRTRLYKYVYYYLQTNAFRRYFSNDDTKQINQVTQSILKNALIPLPPLAELERVIESIEKLLASLPG